ncbi:MAG: hypothetical protein JRJ62_05965 [Deltaproteobacteria bacterium]|nr:hypothetical protein [Deltaproteobacteria bacterium]
MDTLMKLLPTEYEAPMASGGISPLALCIGDGAVPFETCRNDGAAPDAREGVCVGEGTDPQAVCEGTGCTPID